VKPCDTPLCEGVTVKAALCRRCYERKRWADPEVKARRTKQQRKYAKREYVRQAHREACQAYREAGKVEPGECLFCGGPTSGIRAKRCLACYRARILPGATKRGLLAIWGEKR
jgi:hypothetical protein